MTNLQTQESLPTESSAGIPVVCVAAQAFTGLTVFC